MICMDLYGKRNNAKAACTAAGVFMLVGRITVSFLVTYSDTILVWIGNDNKWVFHVCKSQTEFVL